MKALKVMSAIVLFAALSFGTNYPRYNVIVDAVRVCYDGMVLLVLSGGNESLNPGGCNSDYYVLHANDESKRKMMLSVALSAKAYGNTIRIRMSDACESGYYIIDDISIE